MNNSENEKVEELLLLLAELVIEKNKQESIPPAQALRRSLSKEQFEAKTDILIRQIASLRGIKPDASKRELSEIFIGERNTKEIILTQANRETLSLLKKLFGSSSLGTEIAVESYLFFKEMCLWETRGIFTKNELEVLWEYYCVEVPEINTELFSFVGSPQGLLNAINYISGKKPLLFLFHKTTKEKLRNKIIKISNAHLHLIIEEMILSIHGVGNRSKDKFMQTYASKK
ncbi:MAG: hypothetical protein Q8933_13325 [Bacteroidota bacterium]|nr:hypothetical protein [Bacteroidota bacterium]MDP4191482.1 hypothetical protein [Bacteroidota bacterium]MDP4194881.1 hypothetical protein [Bacteroidota bacterium]